MLIPKGVFVQGKTTTLHVCKNDNLPEQTQFKVYFYHISILALSFQMQCTNHIWEKMFSLQKGTNEFNGFSPRHKMLFVASGH